METPDGNVEVLNDIIDLYRYFDATKKAEFLYDCVKETVTTSLPEEVQYLERNEKMTFTSEHFDMPKKISGDFWRVILNLYLLIMKRTGILLSNDSIVCTLICLNNRKATIIVLKVGPEGFEPPANRL